MTKGDKNWEHALNNRLCVEEPFNTSRNLGNTVDEYSFRGLHQELRRAFDLVSATNLEEACEQYVFPKEEERVWSRPPPQPRPVMLRSASQTHSGSGRGGRGGHRGGRHNNYRGGNTGTSGTGTGGAGTGGVGAGANGAGPNRRSSSSAPNYDQTLFTSAMGIQQDLSWFQGGQFPIQYTPEMLAQLAYQQENLRQFQQLYAQNPLYSQLQSMGGHTGMSSGLAAGQTQSADRSRTNSFDNPPLSAPLRPDLYALYGMTLGQPFFAQTAKGYGTYPSSPATTSGTGPDYRRPLQRSTVHTEKGASASSSSLRSQSQPAARSQPVGPSGVNGHHPLSTSQSTTNVSGYDAHNTYANGVPIPNFISFEDDHDETPKASSTSPRSEEERKYMAYFKSESPKPISNALHPQALQSQQMPNGIAFGDVAHRSANLSSSPTSGRLSGEQLPQSLLERRIKRSSRSPSPLGHARAQSTGARAASVAAANQSAQVSTRPLVVNGSNGKHSMAATPRPSRTIESATSSTDTIENPLQLHSSQPIQASQTDKSSVSALAAQTEQQVPLVDRPPLVVNGSNNNTSRYLQNDDSSFRERIAMMSSQYMNPQAAAQDATNFQNGNLTALSSRQMMMSYQPQPAAIAPLDLAIGDRRPIGSDVSLLSPVYETRTPSPTVVRKLDRPGNSHQGEQKKTTGAKTSSKDSENGTESSPETQRHGKSSRLGNQSLKPNGTHGHARVMSESGWQKAGKNKKKGVNGTNNIQQVQAEQPPKRDSERKGG